MICNYCKGERNGLYSVGKELLCIDCANTVQMLNTGSLVRAKHDASQVDKMPWAYMPWEALGAVCKVLQDGGKKYGQENWRKGAPWREFAGSALRHLLKWLGGEDLDESGNHHLAHCATNVLFILTWVIRGDGTDDRIKPKTKEEGT